MNSQTLSTQKTIKAMLIVALTLLLLSSGLVLSNAIDKKVSASFVKNEFKVITAKEAKKNPNWEKGFYKSRATGYVTSSTKHYANAELLAVMQHEAYSGRKWGTGKVTATTAYGKNVSMIVPDGYGSKIYYGF